MNEIVSNKQILNIDHIAIAIDDESDVVHYENLGLKVELIETIEEQGVKVYMIPVGNTKIELLLPLSSDSPVGKFIQKRGKGIHHIALEVDNIQRTITTCQDNGIQTIGQAITKGAGGTRIIFLDPKSTGNVLIELRQKE